MRQHWPAGKEEEEKEERAAGGRAGLRLGGGDLAITGVVLLVLFDVFALVLLGCWSWVCWCSCHY